MDDGKISSNIIGISRIGYLAFLTVLLNGTWSIAQISLQHDQAFNSSDVGFGYGDGFNHPTRCVLALPDNRILIGGNFDKYHGKQVSRLVCLNENLEVHSDFYEPFGVNGAVRCITRMTSGQIMVGGGFTEFNGLSALRVFRLNSDGSSDSLFHSLSGTNGLVHSIIELADGQILLAGDFSKYQGEIVNRVVQLFPNGFRNTGFSVGSGPDGVIYQALVLPDESIILVGAFQTFSGIPCNGVAKILPDGTVDSSFSIDLSVSVAFQSATLLEDQTLLLGGAFQNPGPDVEGVLINVNQSGEEVLEFDQLPEINGPVFYTNQHSNGKLLVAGGFTEWEGQAYAGVSRLNSNGDPDPDFYPTSNIDGEILHGTSLPNGEVLLGGRLTSFGGETANHIVTLNQGGAIQSPSVTGTGCDRPVLGSLALNEDAFLVFGEMERYNGHSVGHVFKIDDAGELDTGFDCGSCANSPVTSAKRSNDGGLIIGGAFSCFNGVLRSGLVKLTESGAVDPTLDVGSGFDGTVSAIHILPNGNIAVSGNFDRYNNIPSPGLVVLSQTGAIVPSFNVGQGFDGPVLSLSNIGNKLIVGGQFSRYQGQPCINLTLLNEQGNIESNWQNVEVNGPVYALAAINEKILVGGRFLQVNGTDQQYLASLDENGALEQDFNLGHWPNNVVFSIFPLNAGQEILVGGDFTEFAGQQAKYLALINGNGALIPGIQPGCEPNGPINSLTQGEDNSVLLGGEFSAVGDTGRNRLAKLSSTITSHPSDSSLRNLTISPNPTNDYFIIKGMSDDLELSIHNMLGETVFEQSIVFPSERVSVLDLESGTYFIKLKKHENSTMKRLVKVK